MLRKINDLVQSLSADPLTVKKAVLLCCYAEGLRFAADKIFTMLKFNYGIMPNIVYLAAVLLVVREMGKDALRRILVWRKIPFAVFVGVLVMYLGFVIILSELNYLFETVFPIPDGFYWFYYEPENKFLLILSNAIFPGFTEELFFRGILARRFFRSYSIRRGYPVFCVNRFSIFLYLLKNPHFNNFLARHIINFV